MQPGLAPIGTRPDNLTEMVYAAIRDAIVEQKLAPGTRVSEARLAEQLNVSKTPVREAMLRLIHMGLLEADGQRGNRVPAPSLVRLRAAYELREGLEAQAARLAALSRTDDELAALFDTAAMCLREAERGAEDGFRTLDRSFHGQLGEYTHNPLLHEQITSVYDLTWSLRLRDAPAARGFMVGCSEQHVDIVGAVRDREPERADQLMREHVHKVATNVMAAMSRDAPRATA